MDRQVDRHTNVQNTLYPTLEKDFAATTSNASSTSSPWSPSLRYATRHRSTP